MIYRAQLARAEALLAELLDTTGPADAAVSRYFRAHRNLGQQDRAFVAETVYAVLRRRRSLEAAAQSSAPRDLAIAALVRVRGLSARALEDVVREEEQALVTRVRAAKSDAFPAAVRADLPDWLWERLTALHGADQAMRVAQGLLNPAPLDLRVNLAKLGRDEVLAQLRAGGVDAQPTPYSPAGVRLAGKPAINRHPLFKQGAIEVQDEGSQVLAYLLAPRRGEMVADYCAGAGGKTLALAMLMRGTGRIYAMDVSARRLAELAPRAARAGVTNVHPLVLSGDGDARAKRLAGKLDRVLVDAPCSGFGTLRRNPDLKWRHGAQAIAELAVKQAGILEAAARLVKPGGRLVYATCSILPDENESIADAFAVAHADFAPLSCRELLAAQRIELESGERLRLWPHVHGCDGFFAAAFERR
ncbi:MAG: RsmB/NOP family class I SAM-dependent RNA methyltransferase [Betaproteobacteria bacterium]|nr:RsmB/NOP family class I SAM-dependent RNA methyltransferase [Betaproteobacteria bacterium]MDH4323749.1 RsmB/NOP family class I SAM-dependent RNA methyltransferase [Betaproteobacteria bacterium]MDH5210836.1 RsmB/NOP family class I SAM-dependent RNA methyltransferase [Betaproteobacteria bacterium]MDH5577347.1 RsmB/NOP family class I SAM-dependent RNA methyltransferase [Betaproteobacteria bacterium]